MPASAPHSRRTSRDRYDPIEWVAVSRNCLSTVATTTYVLCGALLAPCWLGALLLRFLVQARNAHVYAPEQNKICVHAHHGATKPGGSSSGGVCGSGSGGVGGVVGRRRTLRLPAADQAQAVRASGYSCRSGRKVHTAADCYGASSRADVFGSCSAGLLAERAMQER